MTDEERLKKRKKKKNKKAGKRILLIISFIVIALAAFVITVKIAKPDAQLTAFIPKWAYAFIDEKILGNTTTEPQSVTASAVSTTLPEGRYLPIEEFSFDSAEKGSLLGTILAGGKTGFDSDYIYYVADCDGIYRFSPSDESYYRIYSSGDYLSNLNIMKDKIYFTSDADGKLYCMNKNGTEAEAIADNVKTAYVYSSNIYYVTKDNRLCIMNRDDKTVKTLYSSASDEIRLVGISLSRVYFTAEDSFNSLRFFTIDNEGKEKAVLFRELAGNKEIINPVMEDGYFYYFTTQSDGTYNLFRQKFGSEQQVMLVEGAAVCQYPEVDLNRLYYGNIEGDTFYMKELNMNSGEKKILLRANGVDADNSLVFQHGGSYDFIIGYKRSGSWIHYASSIYTSSNNIMEFKDGYWKY